MIIRLMTAAALGFTVTAGLLYVMQFLVEISEAASAPPPRIGKLTFAPTIDDTPVEVKVPRIERPAPPPLPPRTRPPADPGENFVAIPAPVAPPPGRSGPEYTNIGNADGGLMTIINVEPAYPRIAAARGLEGRVLVRFDVTDAGTVRNAVVVESSNRIFDKAALDAVKRSRFRPRIVDGVPQPSSNLMRLFTFEMEQN